MRLVKDIKGKLAHYSTQALTAAAGIPAVWTAIPDYLKAEWPPSVIHWVLRAVGVIAAFGLVGKFIDQSAPKEPAP